MKPIFTRRQIALRTRHYKNARVHTFYIVDSFMLLLTDAAGITFPVFGRCTFAVSFVQGGDVCLA